MHAQGINIQCYILSNIAHLHGVCKKLHKMLQNEVELDPKAATVVSNTVHNCGKGGHMIQCTLCSMQ